MRTNTITARAPAFTHEGGRAQHISPALELRRSVLACMLWENTFYETGSEIANRIALLVSQVDNDKVAALAIEARDKMYLRHVPLFLIAELSKKADAGPLVADTLARIIQRPDELGEFISIYRRDKRRPLSAGVKRGLARAFTKFGGYQLAKWNSDNAAVKLRDVMFLVHPKPVNDEQAALFKALAENAIKPPDTWETNLSAGADKKETFERLLRERKLGGLAVLRNLRNMQQAGVDETLIIERLHAGAAKALPFRFIAAARYAPRLEPAIEVAMLKAAEQLDPLPGRTVLLVDVSGSMDAVLSAKSEMRRFDAACGLAIHLREKASRVTVYTFSERLVEVPPRRGFALRDAIVSSQPHSGTYLATAADALYRHGHLVNADRLIIITDEQAHDDLGACRTPLGYIVNVASYKNGIGYGNGWTHVDGWSERIIDYINAVERAE